MSTIANTETLTKMLQSRNMDTIMLAVEMMDGMGMIPSVPVELGDRMEFSVYGTSIIFKPAKWTSLPYFYVANRNNPYSLEVNNSSFNDIGICGNLTKDVIRAVLAMVRFDLSIHNHPEILPF